MRLFFPFQQPSVLVCNHFWLRKRVLRLRNFMVFFESLLVSLEMKQFYETPGEPLNRLFMLILGFFSWSSLRNRYNFCRYAETDDYQRTHPLKVLFMCSAFGWRIVENKKKRNATLSALLIVHTFTLLPF